MIVFEGSILYRGSKVQRLFRTLFPIEFPFHLSTRRDSSHDKRTFNVTRGKYARTAKLLQTVVVKF